MMERTDALTACSKGLKLIPKKVRTKSSVNKTVLGRCPGDNFDLYSTY